MVIMPKCFRDCVLVPIPKGGVNLSSSDGYHPITLVSCLSEVLERIILNQYSSISSSHHLQFGFKTGSSTSLCTGIMKCVVSTYLQNGSSVLGCVLDELLTWLTMVNYSLFWKSEAFLIQSFVLYLLGIVLSR